MVEYGSCIFAGCSNDLGQADDDRLCAVHTGQNRPQQQQMTLGQQEGGYAPGMFADMDSVNYPPQMQRLAVPQNATRGHGAERSRGLERGRADRGSGCRSRSTGYTGGGADRGRGGNGGGDGTRRRGASRESSSRHEHTNNRPVFTVETEGEGMDANVPTRGEEETPASEEVEEEDLAPYNDSVGYVQSRVQQVSVAFPEETDLQVAERVREELSRQLEDAICRPDTGAIHDGRVYQVIDEYIIHLQK